MTPQEIMAAEAEWLLAEEVASRAPAYAAVFRLSHVVTTPGFLRRDYPCHFLTLAAGHAERSQVQHCPRMGSHVLSCHVGNNSYREDYIAFAQEFHGLGTGGLPGTLNVDHLFNRERARQSGHAWIRMILLPGGTNKSHGAGYEKARTSGIGGKWRRERSADAIILLKAWGVPSPRKGMPLSAETIAHARMVAARLGVPVEEVIQTIENLMDVAAYRSNEA